MPALGLLVTISLDQRGRKLQMDGAPSEDPTPSSGRCSRAHSAEANSTDGLEKGKKGNFALLPLPVSTFPSPNTFKSLVHGFEAVNLSLIRIRTTWEFLKRKVPRPCPRRLPSGFTGLERDPGVSVCYTVKPSPNSAEGFCDFTEMNANETNFTKG